MDEHAEKLSELAEQLGPMITSLDDPNVELLLPQLRPFLHDMDGHLWMKHPWVNSMTVFVNQCNRVWQAKFSMMRRYLSCRDFGAYLFVAVERPWRYDVLANFWRKEHLSKHELRKLLPQVWTDVEFPSRNLYDPLFLFRETGFVTDNREAWKQLPDPIPVWRGGLPNGISWTARKETAEFFARRFSSLHEDEQLWETTVPKSSVFGYFTGRGESEVVIDPSEHHLQ